MSNLYIELANPGEDMHTLWIESYGRYYPFSYDPEFDDKQELRRLVGMIEEDSDGFASSDTLPKDAAQFFITEEVVQ